MGQFLVFGRFFFCDKLVQKMVENIIDLNYLNHIVAVAAVIKR